MSKDGFVSLRLDSRTLKTLQARARTAGKTRSEWIRGLIMVELGQEAPPGKYDTPGSFTGAETFGPCKHPADVRRSTPAGNICSDCGSRL